MVTWKTTKIDDIAEVLNGDRGINYPKPNEIRSSGIPFVNAGHLQDCKIKYSKMEYISTEHYARMGGAKLQPNDILICLRGSLGKYAMNYAKSGALASSLASIRTIETKVNPQFLFQVLGSYIITKKIEQANNGSSQPNLSATDVKMFELLFPPLPEQRRIATALSDTDAYIAALEKLIAKKRNIKKGAMQELLTGKRRLPGFSGEWITKTWQDVLDGFTSGATPYRGKPEYYKGKIKWVSSGELKYSTIYDTIEHISSSALVDASLTIHPARTFLMAITGLEAEGTRGSCALLGVEATTNQSCMAIYGTSRMSTEYLYHYYILNGDSLAFQYCQGTKQQSYTAKIVRALPMFFPPNPEEQAAITSILSDMDVEINTLMAKLNKVRNIKQGMMQELLTGRIRLLEQETETIPEAKLDAKVIKLPKREPEAAAAQTGHNQQFDDAVMIAGIVNALYSDKFPLGRKKVQKCLYLLRRHQDESIAAFKKKAAGPYADEVRYKGGEPIARSAKYITTTTTKDKGTTFARGGNISQALGYISGWGKQADIQWVADKLKYKKVDELELLATVDMAICDLGEAGTLVSVASIKHLIATNEEWKAKLKKQTFSDANIARAIKELQTLL